ncbi:MAG: hypothetical protein V4463_02525 [Pseudomonadota bacterium]
MGRWTASQWLTVAAGLACLGAASAAPMQICISDVSMPPFIYKDRDGTIQVLLKQAAIRAGLPVILLPMPIKRCLAELTAGKVAARIAGVNDLTRDTLRFPMNGKDFDAERALGVAREVALRLKGSELEWDGQHFSKLNHAVLMQPGFPGTELLLKSLKIPIDSGGKTMAINLDKLLAKRGEVVVGLESSARVLMEQAPYAGKFEMLPIPVHTVTHYLAFSRVYYEAYSDDVERLWNAIVDTKRSPEFETARQAVHSSR